MQYDQRQKSSTYDMERRPDRGYKTRKTKTPTSSRAYAYRLFIPVAPTFFISEKHKSWAVVRLWKIIRKSIRRLQFASH